MKDDGDVLQPRYISHSNTNINTNVKLCKNNMEPFDYTCLFVCFDDI